MIYDDVWILENWDLYRNWNTLCNIYNEKFEVNIGYNTFKSHCNRELRLNFKYTKEQDEWLCINYPRLGRIKGAEEFNKIFNTRKTPAGIKMRCGRLGLKVNDDRKHEIPIENSGHYHKPGTIVEKGHGYLYIKRSDGKWVQLQRYIAGADDLDDYVVIFLDKNKRNFDPENLATIPRSYLGPMTKNKFWSEFPEVTKTGLVWCELHDVLKRE